MTRDELSDKLLKHLYENREKGSWNVYEVAKEDFGIDDYDMCVAISDEFTELNIVQRPRESNRKTTLKLKYEGKEFYEKYKSFTGYKNNSKKETAVKNRKPFKDRYWLPIMLIPPILTFFFGRLTKNIDQEKKSPSKTDSIITKTDTVVIVKTDTIYLPDSLKNK